MTVVKWQYRSKVVAVLQMVSHNSTQPAISLILTPMTFLIPLFCKPEKGLGIVEACLAVNILYSVINYGVDVKTSIYYNDKSKSTSTVPNNF